MRYISLCKRLYLTRTVASNMEQQLQEQFHKAFYDLVKRAVKNDDHDYIVQLYVEIRERLANMIIRKSGPAYQRLLSDFDVEFFEQRLRHKAFDAHSMASLVNTTFQWVHDLQMPIRDSDTDAAKQRVLSTDTMAKMVPAYINEVHSCIDTMEKDMKEFYDNRNHPVVREMIKQSIASARQ